MHLSPDILDKFFAYACTEEEAAAVADHLAKHPELLDAYFLDEWNEPAAPLLTTQKGAQIKFEVLESIASAKRVVSLWRRIAVAASLLVGIGFSWWLLTSRLPTNATPVLATVKQPPTWEIRKNVTDKLVRIELEDGTVVRLEPHAGLKYHSFKNMPTRDVWSNGNLFLKVTADKAHPFTVYTQYVSITVLGTQFSIREENGRVSVQLFEGKVMVRPLHRTSEWKKDTLYMKPGEEFVYDQWKGLVAIHPIPDVVVKEAKVPGSRRHSATIMKGAHWYMFNNQSLSNVFEQLEELYDIKITYDAKDVENVYFIGRFEKTDPVETILNNIALLKKLQIRREGKEYFISKP